MKCNVSRDFCPGYRCNPIVCHSSMSRVGAQNMDKWIFPYREQNSFPTFPLLFRVRHGNWLIPAFALPSMDRGAWQATVCRVTKSWTWLKSLTTHTHLFLFLYKLKGIFVLGTFSVYELINWKEVDLYFILGHTNLHYSFTVSFGQAV